MSSGFIHKQKLLQKPTDNCELGISSGEKKKPPNGEWEDNSGIIFPRYFKCRNSILCTQKDKILTEKYQALFYGGRVKYFKSITDTPF